MKTILQIAVCSLLVGGMLAIGGESQRRPRPAKAVKAVKALSAQEVATLVQQAEAAKGLSDLRAVVIALARALEHNAD